MKAIEVGLKNPYLVVVVVMAVIVVGVVSMGRLPADLLPQFNTPAVQIVTFYPGMPPEVMERDIMSRLQRWTGQSVGIEHQEAKAMLGVCIVKDFFREDISFDTAMSQVTSYAMSDMFYLPPGTIPPMVMPFDPTASVPLCLVSVSSPTMSEKDLYDVAYRELRNRLQSIRGVIAPAVYGGVLRRILAYVDPMELEARGLSPMDVVKTIQSQSIFIPTGNAKFGDIDYQIVANAMPEKVEQLNDIPIKTEDGAVVFMRDIGVVKDSNQIQSNIVNINGRRQAYIPIYRQPGANTIEIISSIKTKLSGILARLREMDPRAKDMSLEVVMDQSDYVKNSIAGLKVSAGLGALLAGVVVFLFLRSFRSTVVIVFAIPLAILATMIGMFYTGDTINSMTLGGLALAIGILVDQSIVVLDNITRHLRMGKDRWQAALDGTREVSMPVLVSTITFVVVFFPVVFLTGMARFLFQPLAITVVFAVSASYVVSMFVIPSFCARFLSIESVGGAKAEGLLGTTAPPWFERWFETIMDNRGRVVLGSVLLLALAALLLSRSGTELFPQVDSNQFTIYVRLPSGTRIENTEATVNKIEKVIIAELGEADPEFPRVEKHPDSNMRILISNIGVLMDWPAAYTPNGGPMDAFVLVQLKGGKPNRPGTFEAVDILREKLNAQFPGVDFAFDTGGMMTAALNFGLPSPINIQIQGSNLFTGEEVARHVLRIASRVPGAIDVRIAQRMDYPQIGIEVDRVKAAQLGLVQEDVIKNVVTATNSSIGFNPAFWIAPENKNHYFIGAQYAEEGIVSLETLRNIPITGGNTERPIPLRNIADFYRSTGPSVVNHVNITRTFDVFANVAQGYDVGSVAGAIEERIREAPIIKATAQDGARGVEYKVSGLPADIAGKVTEVMRGSDGGVTEVRVEITAARTARSGEFTVQVKSGTRLDKKDAKELAVGNPVAIWFATPEFKEGSVAQQVRKIDKAVSSADDMPGYYQGMGYTFSIRGEVETMRASFKEFAFGLLIAILLVYLAMVAQLRSFSTPMVILVSIPLAFVGVAAVLFITGTNLSIPVFMGIIMVAGIVVEYAIILLEFANQRIRDGLPVRQAIKEATWIRLRPILMTSMTTWLALIPMAIGAAGGEANAPLARTIIGGVLAATVLTLIVVPCFYVILKRDEQGGPITAPIGA